ncbi:hypothetical protein MMC11_006468 [Xylographa trunciseda]|nr:hypothetical protein [Xylographa trunciseda]
MFLVRAFMDSASHDGQISRLAAFHYAQTLQLLQARLNAFEHGQQDNVFRDSTIMVISTLADAAELTGDFAAAKNHIEGLLKIVSLRGGVRSLNTHNNMQVKVCRADLRLALRSGNRSRLFQEGIVWDCFIADSGMIRCSHEPHETQIHTFVDTLDPKLANSWKDLHAFSCMSNLAYQTTRKLSPETYNEMMISILYRLTHLSFKGDPLQEVIRTALLTFSSTIFLTRHYMEQRYEHLFNLFSSALLKLCQSTSIIVPRPVMLWLIILYHAVVYRESSSQDCLSVWLDKAVPLTRVDTWPQIHIILRSVMWVDFVHDAPGKKAFEAAIQRLERLVELDVECAPL